MRLRNQHPVVIVGSGLAGLACARRLQAAGLKPLVLDKGRIPGGRVSTRVWPSGACFDHGAQFIRARQTSLSRCLEQARQAGAASVWTPRGMADSTDACWVGRSGMATLTAFLARNIDLQQGVEVIRLEPGPTGVRVLTGDSAEPVVADRVVVTLPAPQVAALDGVEPAVAGAAQAARYAPCLTVLFELDRVALADRDVLRPSTGPVGWLARQSSKPDGPRRECWVGQATGEWSCEWLDRPTGEWSDALLQACLGFLGVDPGAVRQSVGHRWRYARVTQALQQPFLRSADGRLLAGGDWCLGARVEAAWCSGEAMAEALIHSD